MKFLQTKFDAILITLIFFIIFASYLATRERDILLLVRDCFLVLTALLGYKRATETSAAPPDPATEVTAKTESGDISITRPAIDDNAAGGDTRDEKEK
jgi:hypothetical protein